MKKLLAISSTLLFCTLISFGQSKPSGTTTTTSTSSTTTTTVKNDTVTVDSVFLKYYKATGGIALWDSLETYTMKRSYRSGSSADYDAEIFVSMANQAMSKSKIILKRNFIYGVKGTDGWLKIPLGSYDKVTKY